MRTSCTEAGDGYFAGMAEAARTGLQRMPCDVLHDSSTVADAVRRLRANLPPVTAFEVLEGCRRDLDVFEQQLQGIEAVSSGPRDRSSGGGEAVSSGIKASPQDVMT